MQTSLRILHLKQYPIFSQLQLEEALLRSDKDNWCVINEGSARAIVMGISGKPSELLDQTKVRTDQIPVIKRFSGGGTVIVDQNTLFISFICQKELHSFPIYPEPILKWTAQLYEPLFEPHPFELRENDYVIGEKKCGGNAQYIQKGRWLHHTSFLWDFDNKNMEYLLHPKKTPAYRAERPHQEFLCSMSQFFPSKEEWLARFKAQLALRYKVEETDVDAVMPLLERSHRKAILLL